MKCLTVRLAAVWLLLFTCNLQAQEESSRDNALRVFLDCNSFSCDDDYLRTEINFVNWVRDRTLSQVHLIVTTNSTGAGGQLFVLDFIGIGELAGFGDELTYTSNTTDTQDEIINGLTRVIAVGLARFSTLIGQHEGFDIRSSAAAQSAATDRLVRASEVEDPWNFWVFEVGTEISLRGEETQTSEDYGLSFDAQRTTDTWKFEFEAEGDFSRDERERSNGTIIIDERESWGTDVLLAYALADHWSVGIESGIGSASRRNEDMSGSFYGVVEYSLFPYAEAPRKSFTARYDLGARYYDWEEETIFRQLSETRAQHRFELRYYQRQPWGTATVSMDAQQYLHDTGLWNLSFYGNLSFRVSRGLNLTIRADYALIEDQLFVSRSGLTDEEILLGQFDRPTDFDYSIRVGLTYEFGSIFNNVVNNRFGTGGR